MPDPILKIIDVLFFVFHTILVFFNILGWLVPRWRLANFITLFLTAISWFVLGIWYGWGYCICVDWHWTVREQLGYQNTHSSYIHFLIHKLTNIDIPAYWVDLLTVVLFFVAFIISAYLNVKKWRAK